MKLDEEFGFEDDAWIQALNAAKQSSPVMLLDGYEILSEVGRGGQGVVYRARQPGTKRVVAIKRVTWRDDGQRERAFERFDREVEVAANLRHPGIATVYERIDEGRSVVMEWVDGKAIDVWADSQRNSGDATKRIVAVVEGAIAALVHAHGRGIIHRDIKPSNVLVDPSDQARIVDFGLARELDASDERYTLPGSFAGTPSYAAPEQIDHGLHEADVRSDVYAVGALLYRCLTGVAPFEASTLATLFDRVRSGVVAAVSERNPTVDRDLAAIVQMSMRIDREQRYTTMAEFGSDLAAWREQRPVRARQRTRWDQLRSVVKRHKLAVTATAIATLALTSVGVTAVMTANELATERQTLLQTIGERDAALTLAKTHANEVERELRKSTATNSAIAGIVDAIVGTNAEAKHAAQQAFASIANRLDTTRMPVAVDVAIATRFVAAEGLQKVGQHAEAIAQFERIVADGRRSGASFELANALATLGRVALDEKRFDDAAQLYEEGEAVRCKASVAFDPNVFSLPRLSYIEALARAGRRNDAQRVLGATRAPHRMVLVSVRARVEALCDDLGLAAPDWLRGEAR
ncbi:MAG: serine/threonine protein kinase [Planctomycetes bacterium]|nr:serine/threonine protein kinase [Planctomycetota bacterium]